MPVRRLSAQALSSRSPDHVGLGPGLIDEDAVDGPRQRKLQVMSSLRGRMEDTGALDGAQLLLGWRSSDDKG